MVTNNEPENVQAEIRLVLIATHPVHYFTPLYSYLASRLGAFQVMYLGDAFLWANTHYDPEFDRFVNWDAPLLDGYEWTDMRLSLGGTWIAQLKHARALRRALREWIAEFKPNVVLVPGWTPTYLIIVRELSRHGIPVIIRPEARVPIDQRVIRGLVQNCQRRMVTNRAAAAAVIGSAARDELLRLGVSENVLFPSPYAVALSPESERNTPAVGRDQTRARWNCTPDSVVFLYVGKLAAYKGVDRLLRAFAQMEEDASRARLVIVGEGPDGPALRDLARQLKIEKNVIWSGFANQSELPELYRASDVFVLFSHETWGLVVNEAMAFSLPCVVSLDAGASRDLVAHGLSGYRVNTAETGDAAMYLGLMMDSGTRSRMGHNALKILRTHTVEAAGDGVIRAAINAAASSKKKTSSGE